MRSKRFRRRSTIALAAWLVAWALAGAAAVHRNRVAMAELRDASTPGFFDLGGFTREATNFQWLLRAPGAERRFENLVVQGSPSAKVFGACGLYLIRSDRFESVRRQLSRDDSEVSTGGCIRTSRRLGDLAQDFPTFCPHFRMGVVRWALTEAGWLTGR